jgi:long-chain acyl-CoA synthetase
MFVHDLVYRGKSKDIAIISGTQKITYKELQQNVAVCRSLLYSQGIRLHDTIAIFSRNSAEYIYAYMAAASLGAVVVPINFQLSNREIAYILKDGSIHYIITYKPLELAPELSVQGYTGNLKQFLTSRLLDDTDLPQAPALPDDFDNTQDCVIIYTSGTTGSPKGAVLSHKNLVCNAGMFEKVLHVNATDNVLCVLPMYHCFAWTCAVLNSLYGGATITILDAFSPKETAETIHTQNVSVLYVVPSICSLLSRLAPKEALSSVRLVVIGGTTLPMQIAKDFSAKFGLSISEGYGLSEASPVVSVNPPGKEKVGSIGLPLPGIDVKIIDSNGKKVAQGESGELLVRGDNVMRGYWNLPDATALTIRDGWLHTSDIARMDEDGYLYIVDRLKDLIISMGENIYPREIEELLYTYEGITEASVIGIDDRLRGQVGVCFYCAPDDVEINIRSLKQYLQTNLALYKIPRDFKRIKKLPQTATGKISKIELRNIYLAGKKK